ncbi:hypothetical protein [Nitratidesulfovibrio liaohensis]|uniref:Uncharacterized protein n=1 Tax=Nitratidesulfovibrio liaohensis TaxID=2604158 RepID=A0ABY9R229_9BACT|nr:hypothetical protein [Nitratidesulfovibrio liaohensis]WMW65816.1 hypothetical protein KPS_000329 [Nitratidesulfovibrio liaohensis]
MTEPDRTMHFYLFRLILEPMKKLTSLADAHTNKADVLAKILKQGLEVQVSQNITCLTSKVYDVASHGLYFQFGEIHKKKSKDFDKENKEFIDTIKDDTNCAHCLYDIKLQLLAIEKKNLLSSPKTMANRIALAINSIINSDIHKEILTDMEALLLRTTQCKARQIHEPNLFIEELNKSYRVVSYKINMLPPNPIDFDDTIKRPLDDLMGDTGASSAAVQITNVQTGLNTARLVPLTRDVAAYGAGAEAKIMDSESSPKRPIKLDKNENAAFAAITLPQTLFSTDFSSNASDFLKQIITKFQSIKKNHEKQ